MHKPQEQVRQFHWACGLTAPEQISKPYDVMSPGEVEMRVNLIKEELKELTDALWETEDFPEVIDALCDLLYVVYGFGVSIGTDLEPFFEEVHMTNMKKCSGPKREDGKQLKPEGWVPPRIKEMLYGTSDHQPTFQPGVLRDLPDPSGLTAFVSDSQVQGFLPSKESSGRLSNS